MNSWRNTTMGELMKVEHGFAFKGEYFSESGELIVLTPGNFHETGGFRLRPEKDRFYQGKFPDRYLLNKNDLIVAMTEQGEGLLGSSAIIPESGKYLHNQRIGLVRPKRDVADKTFLYYLFNTAYVRQQIRNSSAGAKIRHTSPERIYRTKVRVPENNCQAKIAAILKAYDDLIEANKRRVALLEKLAEEIYREWFVRFRFPGYEKVKKVKGVPDGWEVKRLGSILELCYGKALKESDRVPGEFHVYGSGGVVGTHNEALVRGSGLIVGRKGNVGSVYLSDRGFFPIDTVYFVKSELPNSFLYFLLRSMNFINNDAAVPGLNRNQAYSNQLLLPPGPLIAKFAEIVGSQFDMKHLLIRLNEKLFTSRDQLLLRLISGKVSVEHLDIHLPPNMKEQLKATTPVAAYA